MSPIDEKLSHQFYHWELHGRGWRVWDAPVSPEPPFRPFAGHFLPAEEVIDDGRKPTFLSSLVERLSRTLATAPQEAARLPQPEDEPEPELLVRDCLIEIGTLLPAKLDISREAFGQFLLNLSLCREPLSFELVGVHKRVTAQFAAHPHDAPLVRRQLQSHFPDASFQATDSRLETIFDGCEGEETLVVEFGLGREFMYPLASGKLDAFVGVVGALSELEPGEFGLFQVVWQPVRNPWAESIVSSVTHADGKPFFVNEPELADAAENKVSQPLFAAVVRIMVKARDFDRVLQLSRDLAASLKVFAKPGGNELIPLSNDEYPFAEHVEDALRRQSRRSGMIVNSDELIGFVHLPGSDVRSSVLERESGTTKAAPECVRLSAGLLLGDNVHAGNTIPVRLSADHRVRHTHIIGASGTGKSTLLFNLIRQDIENGQGVAVLDPHGDLIDKILGVIPDSRIDDVVLVDPSDADFPIGFNILAAHSEQEKKLLASDLVSVFRRLSASWGDQMDIVLTNAILAFLESLQRGTLADMRRFLIEPTFRAEHLKTVQNPEIVYYWQRVFPQLTGNRSVGPVLTRLQGFLSQKPIRNMVCQNENKLDFAKIMDEGKIFLAKLSEGLLGAENSYMLGTLLVSKFQQIAMSRQAQAAMERRDYWLYIDEFDHFITPTMAEILKGARKYRLGLTLAHQELHQLRSDPKVESAVATHPCTRIIFRVGDDDAKRLAEGFSAFEAQHLKNLETFHAICRVERSDWDFNLAIQPPETADSVSAEARRKEVITASRKKYAVPRADIEGALLVQLHVESPPPASKQRVEPKRPIAAEKPTGLADAEAVPPPPPVEPPAAEAAPPLAETKPSAEPADRGIGGHQHNLIRKRVEAVARELGYTASRENRTGSGRKIDVVLRKTGRAIACEIAITTTIDHEVGNVAKCVAGGFDAIAVISPSKDRLEKIRAGVEASLVPGDSSRVLYHHPDAFIEYLRRTDVPAVSPPPPGVTTFGKYKVKHSTATLTGEEQREREAAALRMIAETMRRKRKA